MSSQNGSNGSNNGFDSRNHRGFGQGPTPGQRFLRGVSNVILIAGICALVSLAFLSIYIGVAGVVLVAYAFMRLSHASEYKDIDPSAIKRTRRNAMIVLGLCIAVMIVDVAIGSMIMSYLAETLGTASQTTQDVMDALSGATSTWG